MARTKKSITNTETINNAINEIMGNDNSAIKTTSRQKISIDIPTPVYESLKRLCFFRNTTITETVAPLIEKYIMANADELERWDAFAAEQAAIRAAQEGNEKK